MVSDVSTGFWVLIAGIPAILAMIFFIPDDLNAFFNRRRWVLPAIASLVMVAVAVEANGFVTAFHESQVTSCERGNEARVASIDEKHDDIRFTLRPTLRLWKKVVEAQPLDPRTPKPVVDAFNDLLTKLEKGIKRKRKGIRRAIAAQAEVAVEPGSAEVDCDKAFG